jgi:ribonuclease D
LEAISGMPSASARRSGDVLLVILQTSRTSLDDYEPPQRPDDRHKALLKALQKKVASSADALGIAGEVIAPRKELSAALEGDTSGRVFRGWRRELIGEELLQTLNL